MNFKHQCPTKCHCRQGAFELWRSCGHPYVAAEPANSAIEDGERSELQKYVTLCAECESIA